MTRLTETNFWVRHFSVWVLIEEWFTLFTVSAHCVVQATITHTTTNLACCLIHCCIKVATWSMVVTVTSWNKPQCIML